MLHPEFEVIDKRFYGLVLHNAHVERLWTGSRWAEGPAYFGGGKYLIWSDIPNDRLLRFDETDGSVSVFEAPAWNANGHTVDRSGRLIACEHRGRAVTRIEHDGSRTVLADSYDGKRLNSPNDVVVRSDGSIWFTDPTYGIDSEYEGDAAVAELTSSDVYRLDPDNGVLEPVITDMVRPNGIAFSPDESLLYVCDTGISHDRGCPRAIRAYPLNPDGRTVGAGSQLCECTEGVFDGFRVDTNGNLWASAEDGVHCFAPDGTLIGKIRIPEVVANLTFGGPKRNRLYICATTSLYAAYVNAQGATWPAG